MVGWEAMVDLSWNDPIALKQTYSNLSSCPASSDSGTGPIISLSSWTTANFNKPIVSIQTEINLQSTSEMFNECRNVYAVLGKTLFTCIWNTKYK